MNTDYREKRLGTLPSQTPTINSSTEDNEPGDLEETAGEAEEKSG